jgi:hypothetical protein
MSGAFASLALVAVAIFALRSADLTPAFAIGGVGVVFVAGLLGKASGIGLARIRLRLLRIRLERALSS